jgi:hypothetical protein
MKNLGDEEQRIYGLLTAALPPVLIMLMIEHGIGQNKFELLTNVFAELCAAYMYAIVKMSVTENLDSIVDPVADLQVDVDKIPILYQKVSCVLAGYCTAISMTTVKVVGKDVVKDIHELLQGYASIMAEPIYDYVKEERQKNNLGG